MSASTTMTVTIARPVEDVFAVLSDVEKAALWSSNTVEETLLTPGPAFEKDLKNLKAMMDGHRL